MRFLANTAGVLLFTFLGATGCHTDLQGGGEGDHSHDDAALPDDSGSHPGESDGGDDAGPSPVNEGVGRLGNACGESGDRACSDHDSTLPLVCRRGKWEAAVECPGSARCDTREGDTRGNCLDLIAECEGRKPDDEFCLGNDKLTCGRDRVTASTEHCPGGHVCVIEKGAATCVPDTDECAMKLDDCDDAPNACVNTLGSYECRCPKYYTGKGRGKDGCKDILECAAGNGGCDEDPAATCNEVVGGAPTCDCPSGYAGEGRGEDGCTDIDECKNGPVAACGGGATNCTNDPGSYHCNCDASHHTTADARHCELRAWGTALQLENDFSHDSVTPSIALNAKGNAVAVWASTGILSTRYDAATGWIGEILPIHQNNGKVVFDPKVAIDAGGNAIVVWTQGDATSDSIWANRYVAGTGWSGAALIEQNTDGPARSPSIAMDDAGNAVAIWEQSDGTRYNLWGARYTVGDGWSPPALLEQTDVDDAMGSAVAMDAQGNAIAVWMQSDVQHIRAWSKRYVAGDGWQSDVTPLDPNSTGVCGPGGVAIAMDAAGNAVATWTEYDMINSYRIWGRRYTAGSGWKDAKYISNPGKQTANPALAVSESGDATVVWEQTENMFVSVWASRSAAADVWSMPESIEDWTVDDTRRPAVTMDAEGNAIAVWDEYEDPDHNHIPDLWSNRYTVGSGWGSEVRLDTPHPVPMVSGACVVAHASGTAIAIWAQSDSERSHIWTNRFE